MFCLFVTLPAVDPGYPEQVVSTLFLLNSAAGALLNGLISLVLFTVLGKTTESVFRLFPMPTS